MAEKFISFPVADLDGNNLPTTLDNALLHATTALSGLTNGVARRVFVLQNPSPSFTPEAASSFEWTELGDQTLGGSNATTKTLTAAVDSQPFVREVTVFMFNEETTTSIDCVIAGVTASKRVERLVDGFATLRVYHAQIPANTSGDIVFTRGTNIQSSARVVWGWTPEATVEAAVLGATSTQNSTINVSQTVGSGSIVLVASAHRGTGSQSWSAAVTGVKNFNFGFARGSFGVVPVTTAGTLTLECTESGESEGRRADACSIELIPA